LNVFAMVSPLPGVVTARWKPSRDRILRAARRPHRWLVNVRPARSALAHTLSIALFCWGGVLAAREILPRVGYARTRATWLCPANPPGPAQPGAPASTQPQGAF